ncbi:MAG: CHAT domain-containing protein, partial [Cyanobacteria bacterium P01_C01_bin.72]
MKILFLAANPESTNHLNLGEEAREIQDALDSSQLSSEFELIQRWKVRPKDFRRALLRHQPDIVHFSGHGSGKTGLIITNDAGESKKVSGNALAGLFAAFPMVKCVLLNACYAEVQARSIVKHVDYVIGMKDTIYDNAARAFSIGFYDSLGYGKNFEEAFALGSNAILWEYDNSTGQKRDEPRELIP